MWKRNEPSPPRSAPATPPTPVSESGGIPPAPGAGPARPAAGGGRAAIGRSIYIRGEVTGEEDLVIQGRVEGSIRLDNHRVTIGPDGDVEASITGRVVVVEGKVLGNIRSEEQVVLRATARVQGDITSPRLVLEDGARFRGGVDMGELPEFSETPEPQPRAASKAPPPGRSTDGAASAATPGASREKERPPAIEARAAQRASEGGGGSKEAPELFVKRA